MDKNVREAAERLRAYEESDRAGNRDTYAGTVHNQFADRAVVSRAYLAEHRSDDEEALTPRILNTFGFAVGIVRKCDESGVMRFLWYAETTRYPRFSVDEDGEATFDTQAISREVKTCGELRLVCRALDITLNGES